MGNSCTVPESNARALQDKLNATTQELTSAKQTIQDQAYTLNLYRVYITEMDNGLIRMREQECEKLKADPNVTCTVPTSLFDAARKATGLSQTDFSRRFRHNQPTIYGPNYMSAAIKIGDTHDLPQNEIRNFIIKDMQDFAKTIEKFPAPTPGASVLPDTSSNGVYLAILALLLVAVGAWMVYKKGAAAPI